ncbi:MAG: MYG1 family protein [Chlamydiota bacterium]
MTNLIIPRSVGTHDGTFHADEVTACALLLLFDLIDKSKIYRTRDPEILARSEFVCDVGGAYDPSIKRFDHHQQDYQGPLSSAGMIWKYLCDTGRIDEALYDYMNRSLILGIDAHDNGKVCQDSGTCNFSHVISNFVPLVYDAEMEAQNAAFAEALEFVLGHLGRVFKRYHYILECKELVERAMEPHNKYLFFETAIPWIENFFDLGGKDHPALFVIMPSSGHWKLRGIPPINEQRMQVRVPLPLEWAGLQDEELKRVSGIPGAIFCHKGRFISVWETKEDALKALEKVVKG